jgi:hypothetical protein
MARSRKLKIRGVEREIALASNGVLQADVPLSANTDNILTKESDGYAATVPVSVPQTMIGTTLSTTRITIAIVDVLPTTPDANTLYFIKE